MAEVRVADEKDLAHVASLLAVSFSRFRLALDRQVSEQNRFRFVPQIAVPQEAQSVTFATMGMLQWGQGFIMARRLPRVAGRVKRFVWARIGVPHGIAYTVP